MENIKEKTEVQFLKCSALDFPNKFKHRVALTNERQIMLFFPSIIIFNATVFKFHSQKNNVFKFKWKI